MQKTIRTCRFFLSDSIVMLISHMLKSENRAHGLKKVFRSIGFPKTIYLLPLKKLRYLLKSIKRN